MASIAPFKLAAKRVAVVTGGARGIGKGVLAGDLVLRIGT